MKIGTLKAVGHNIADSLASGIGLPIGVYEVNIFAEASAEANGSITVDFLKGVASGTNVTESLRRAIALYKEFLPTLCTKHGVDISDLASLEARFGTDAAYGPHFTVTVESSSGKRSTDSYIGIPGRRLRRTRR